MRPRGDSERGHVNRSTIWLNLLLVVALAFAIAAVVGGWSWDSPSSG